MKRPLHWLMLWGMFVVSSSLLSAQINQADLHALVHKYLPGWTIQTNALGKAEALLGKNGQPLDLGQVKTENPTPSRPGTFGYWFSPTMDLLARQQMKVTTAQEAVDVIRLWHMLWRGENFAKQKLYQARAFAGDWVITVEHDFTNYPGNIMVEHPYELVTDTNHIVQEFRQRCYSYPGSAAIYTNKVKTVYEREIRLNRGRNYPEVLYKELHDAWEEERTP